MSSDFTLTLAGNSNPNASAKITNGGDIALNGNNVGINGNNIALQSISAVTLIGSTAGDKLSVTNAAFIPAVNLQGPAGGDSFVVNFIGSNSYTVTVSGAGAGNTLTINGTGANNTYNINGSPVSLGSEVVSYAGVQSLILNTFNGNDTINIVSTAVNTTVNGGNGSDTYNINSVSNPTTVNLGTGTNLVNLGTLAPTTTGGTLNQITAALAILGARAAERFDA